jgi:divalent metal cation (Fe/Co/Zn/Cd) transporter
MDGIEPELLERAEHALDHTPGVLSVPRLQLRWVGHRLQGAATVQVAEGPPAIAERIVRDAELELRHALPNLDDITIRTVALGHIPDVPDARAW